jgi:SAM-dependent methyltransferase
MDWDEFAGPWLKNDVFHEASLRPVFDGLIARAAPAPGSRVLEVGCGTGHGIVRVAEAVGADGHITGVDIAPPLLRRAAERAPANATFIEADAGSADYPAQGYDAIISNFGTMFFGDTKAAFAHLRTTVPEGAPFDFVVWSGPKVNPWFSLQRHAVVARFPDLPAPEPDAPGPMRYADPEPLVGTLGEAGWGADVETVDLHLTPPGDARALADAMIIMVAAMSLKAVAPTEADLAAVHAGLAEGFGTYERDGIVRVPAQVHYIRARAV